MYCAHSMLFISKQIDPFTYIAYRPNTRKEISNILFCFRYFLRSIQVHENLICQANGISRVTWFTIWFHVTYACAGIMAYYHGKTETYDYCYCFIYLFKNILSFIILFFFFVNLSCSVSNQIFWGRKCFIVVTGARSFHEMFESSGSLMFFIKCVASMLLIFFFMNLVKVLPTICISSID